MNKEITTTINNYNGIKDLFVKREKAILELMPNGADLKRMVAGLMMQVTANPGIMECTGESILACGLTALSLGVETNPAFHHVALVPYNNKVCISGQWKKVKEAQLMIEFRGLIVMATNSGEVVKIDAYIVYDNEIRQDKFSMEYGLEPNIIHKPILNPTEKGDIIGAYAVALFENGIKKFKFMGLADIYKRRDKSQAYQYALTNKRKDTPWIEWEEEQIKKTVIRGLSSTLQLSPVKSQFNRGVALDNLADAGLSQLPYMAQEAQGAGIDIESTFNYKESDPNQIASVDESDFGKATEGENDPQETPPETQETVSGQNTEKTPTPSETTDPTEEEEKATKQTETDNKKAEKAEKAKAKKEAAAAKKKEEKPEQKESPDKTRARVADFIQNNEPLHKEIKRLLEGVFPDCSNIDGAYLNHENLRNGTVIPDDNIKIINDVLVGNEFYK